MDNNGILKSHKNELYAYHEDGMMTNLSTGAKGKMDKSKIKEFFTAPITLNNMADKNPLIVDLISKLGLVAEPISENDKMDAIHNFMEFLNKIK